MSKKTVSICSACGTSPMNHHLLFTLSVMEETLGKVADKFFSFTYGPKWDKLASLIEKLLYLFFSAVGVVRFDTDIEKASTGRSKLIWEEAQKRSIPMEQVVMFGKHIEFYRAKIKEEKNIKKKWFYFHSLPIPPSLLQTGYQWLDDKFILFEKLSEGGVTVPGAKKILTLANAEKAFQQLSKPVILKPQYGSRGRHTTTNINTLEELKKAFSLARQITLYMVMQEHLFGSVYRATIINNELVGFFRADPPQIIGDNIKTINDLIREKNQTRNPRLSEILINEDLISFLKRQGYTLESVQKKDQIINISAKTGRMYGGYTQEMLSEIHPKMHKILKRAAEIVEAPVVGFDLIIEDPTKDPEIQRWGIIECNSLPFIDLHYFALEGPQINLAKNIWDLWTKKV